MLAFMAVSTMHLGHQITYLQIFIMPYLLRCLFQATYPTDLMLCKTTYNLFISESPWWWPTRGRRTHSVPKRLRRKKKPSVHLRTESTVKAKLRTYLVSVAVSAFKVGCRVEGRLRELLASHHRGSSHPFPDQTSPLCRARSNAPGPSTSTPTPIPLG